MVLRLVFSMILCEYNDNLLSKNSIYYTFNYLRNIIRLNGSIFKNGKKYTTINYDVNFKINELNEIEKIVNDYKGISEEDKSMIWKILVNVVNSYFNHSQIDFVKGYFILKSK